MKNGCLSAGALVCYSMLMNTELSPHIAIDPTVRFGKPVVRGTRVPVDIVVGKIAAGMTTEAVMAEYDLTHEQVLGALKYAAKLVSEEDLAFV